MDGSMNDVDFVSGPKRDRPPRALAIQRSTGVTRTERQLGSLADAAFLRLWSYPGVHRDQDANATGQGKEICDLLVVFENDVIIFSDKEVAYAHDKSPEVAWPRWYRKAIKKSAAQISGAERWLKQHPDRVYLDPACTEPFPLPLPSADRMRVHRIAVARGAGDACRAHFGGGTGSLVLDSTLVGADDEVSDGPCSPFAVGHIDPEQGFVHVFDDATLDTVLGALDTVADFTAYLTRKERLLTQRAVFAPGEEDLLAFYLSDVGDDGRNDFVVPDEVAAVALEEGRWARFQEHPQRLAQLRADEVSYLWDDLIDRFARHILDDTQYRTAPDGKPIDGEVALRWLAREPRTRRRLLAQGFVDIANQLGPNEAWKVRVIEPSSTGDPHYVLMVTKQPSHLQYEEYRDARMHALHEYMQCSKVVCPKAGMVVGIAVGPIGEEQGSEDLLYLDCTEWTDEDLAAARSLQKETGFLSNLVRMEQVVKTYPDVEPDHEGTPAAHGVKAPRQRKTKGSMRNKPCPCGSGRKYKHCCGRAGQ